MEDYDPYSLISIKPNEARLCLAMIVKNEAHVIQRCLRSVKPYLKHWVVVDTGSTDGTQEAVAYPDLWSAFLQAA